MFVGNCSGCFQVPTTPLYYWSPYASTTSLLKKPTFQISDILQVKNKPTSIDERILLKNYDRKFEELVRNCDDIRASSRSRHSCHTRDSSTSSGVHEAINYSRKTVSTRCTLPSALEPLQALCSTTPRVYGLGDHRCESPVVHSNHTAASTSKDLKFGIHRILASDFGNEKQNKENAQKDRAARLPSPRRLCECTSDACHIYQRLGFPSPALSAVHALQTPKYTHSSSGADTLPGPYSVLNTEVSMMGSHSKRKRSWSRAVFSNLQRKGLEKRFEVQKYVTKPDRRQLAAMLGLTDAQVKVWFQNRRMKWRHAQQQNNDIETATNPSDKPETEVAEDDDNIKVSYEDNMEMKESDEDDDNDDVIDTDNLPCVNSSENDIS